jgi:hypothetical protein
MDTVGHSAVDSRMGGTFDVVILMEVWTRIKVIAFQVRSVLRGYVRLPAVEFSVLHREMWSSLAELNQSLCEPCGCEFLAIAFI